MDRQREELSTVRSELELRRGQQVRRDQQD